MRNRLPAVAMLTIAALLGGFLAVATDVASPAPANAAAAGDFNPGYLISDENFYDGSSMSAADVQAFLNKQVARCTIGDAGREAGRIWGSTRIADRCLRDFQTSTTSRSANAYCGTYVGSPMESAAQIIAKVGAACGIGQEVLLVLLEKEQSLVTDSWPTTRQFDQAMGYACPDSGPNNSANCDLSQTGFFQQVYRSAWQFKVYKALPASFNHLAGRVNNIRFHPNADCGSSTVFVQNAATAGLYNYTPYQPNQAALVNLYGSGDGCSAYGNRNFWRMYSDWFGSPTGFTSLVRTQSDSTVFVTSGGVKYPISSQSVLAALAPLGPLEFVSENYLAQFTTAHLATQVVRGPDGSIYFSGSGLKLPFSNCDLVTHYGGSCAPSGYVQLDESQMARFTTGPALSRIMGTQEGSRYYLESGAKREILNDQAQVAAGIAGSMNVLTESALSSLPFGAPIALGTSVVSHFGSSAVSILDENLTRWSVNMEDVTGWGLNDKSNGRLREESLAKLSQSEQRFAGLVMSSDGNIFGLSSPASRFSWIPPSGISSRTTPMGNSFLDRYAITDTVGVGTFVKASGDDTIYLISDPLIRPIGSWGTLISMSELGNPKYSIVPQSLISSLPGGPIALEAATLVRSDSDATVYLVNGITSKIPLSSFEPVVEAGISRFSFTDQDRIDAYPMAERVLEYGLVCDSIKYLSAGGKIHEVPEELASQYPFGYMELDKYVCRQLTVGSKATQFVRAPDGSIYQVVSGEKRPIGSIARFYELDASNSGYMNVTERFTAMIPTGPLA